jgi:Fe-S oxidoreductase
MPLFKNFFRGNTLYYPGCLTKFVAKDLAENYRRILQKIGLDFIELPDLEVCCGSPALAAGYSADFKNLAEKNLKVFKEHAVAKIITNCPACFKIFSVDYQKVLDSNWDIKAEHIVQTMVNSKAIGNWKLEIGNSRRSRVTYHDPCHLGRLMGIYDEPRQVLKGLGIKTKEMERNKSYALCCGGGGGVKANWPELANKIAKERIGLAKDIGAECLVTNCPLCYLQLKENSEEIEVKEMSQLIKE